MAPLSPADFLFCCPARSTDSVLLLPPADDDATRRSQIIKLSPRPSSCETRVAGGQPFGEVHQILDFEISAEISGPSWYSGIRRSAWI